MFFYWTKSRTGQWFRCGFEDLTKIIIFSDKKPPLPDNFFSEPPPVMIHSWVRSAFLDEKTNCSASDIWSGENSCQRCILEEVWNQFKFVLRFRNDSKPLLDLCVMCSCLVSTDITEITPKNHSSQKKKLRSNQPNWGLHTVSFNWFLSGLEWSLNLGFCLPNLFDILSEIIMKYQI